MTATAWCRSADKLRLLTREMNMATNKILTVVCGAMLLSTSAADAQNENALKRALEGTMVTVKIDMPATQSGIDLYPDRDPQIEFSKYGDRIKRYGISIKAGASVLITLVKVKGKHIEFQLAGGGYGTSGDESVPSTYVSLPSKSQREEDLEEDLRNEDDPVRKRSMERELDRLKRDRQRDYERDKADAEFRAEQARERIRQKRLTAGSRFNVRYDSGVPARALTPGGLMAALGKYVTFAGEAETQVAYPGPGQGTPAGTAPRGLVPIRKGMSEQEVYAVFGAPASRVETSEGSLRAVVCTYELYEFSVEATFVSGALVKYSIASR